MPPKGYFPIIDTTIRDRKVVGLDPGKYSIVYMTSDDMADTRRPTKRLQYTNIQRKVESGSRVRVTKTDEAKKAALKKIEVKKAQEAMSDTNSRTVDIEKYKQYMKVRYDNEALLYEFYGIKDYRVIRWWRFRKKKKSETKLIKRIKKKFGKKPLIAYGSWSCSMQMKGLIPSPTSGMQRLLSKRFEVINVPEFNTTKTCSKCLIGEMEKCLERTCPRCNSLRKKNLKKYEVIEDVLCKKCKKVGYIRSLDVRGLCCCNNISCAVLMNRDYNAAINIRNNLLHYLKEGSWHPKFSYIKGSTT